MDYSKKQNKHVRCDPFSVISTAIEKKKFAIVKGSLSHFASFKIGVDMISMFFNGQTIELSAKGAEFQFLVVQHVFHGTNVNIQMMTMSIRVT